MSRLLPAGLLAFLLSGLQLSGCGQQDLYEPPGSPYQITGRLALPSDNEGVAVLGDYALVAGGQAGLHVIDVSDRVRPALVQTVNTTKYAGSIEVIRTFPLRHLIDVALVIEGTEGVTTYDASNPADVISFEQASTAVDGKRLCVQEPEDPDDPYIVYLAESWKGLRVFRSSPQVPGLLNYEGVWTPTNGYAEDVAVSDGYAYVADDEMGLAVVDVRQLVYGLVRVVSWHDTPGNAVGVALDGGYAYVADGSSGLAVLAIDGPEEPVPLGHVVLDGYSKAVAVRDGLAILAATTGGVQFVDVRDPHAPAFMGSLPSSYAQDVALMEDGTVLVCDRDEGLLVLCGGAPFQDCRDPARVTTLAAEPYGTESVLLTWQATGDDGFLGRASACEVRWAATSIDSLAYWETATPVADPPVPAGPGEEQEFIVGGLAPGTTYHFALRVRDESGRRSALSNPASCTTYDGIVLREPDVSPLVGTAADTFAFTVRYSYGSAPATAEVIIDAAEHHPLSLLAGEPQIGALYGCRLVLPAGAHTYEFAVAAGDGETASTLAAEGPLVGRASFTMGSPEGEPGRTLEETQHGVALLDSLWVCPHEVTQDEWAAMGLPDSSHWQGAERPVENVSWFDAILYCNLRSQDEGMTPAYTIDGTAVTWNREADGYRLPTEAEWEYSCRAGSATAFCNGDITETGCGLDIALDEVGWYCGNTDSTSIVQLKAPNARGLYDMHGNVKEWCWDWYGPYPDGPALDPTGPDSGFRRIVRGGSWFYMARVCRAAAREAYYPDAADDVLGFRVVRTIRR